MATNAVVFWTVMGFLGGLLAGGLSARAGHWDNWPGSGRCTTDIPTKNRETVSHSTLSLNQTEVGFSQTFHSKIKVCQSVKSILTITRWL